MSTQLERNIAQLQSLARDLGLDYYPVDFEVVPPSFMMEVAVYGLPVRMPHWSFGVRWIYQMVQHRMGHSRIFEVVFPGNPNRAYLVNSNSPEENTLVVAHVLGHADFSHNNLLFKRSQEQAGYHIVEQAAAHAHRIERAIESAGQRRVEAVLDAALALEQHIDSHQSLNRPLYPERPAGKTATAPIDPFQNRFSELPGESTGKPERPLVQRIKLPPRPEYDLLWFIAHYAPDMEDWARDIFLAVREESFYFQPVFSCQIMNEGWACHWHARLLREARFLADDLYLEAMKTHSDVVRPYAGNNQVALAINPYHLGFMLWDRIVKEQGMDAALRIRREEDDFGFVRNYLDAELARELDLLVYKARRNGEIRISEADLAELHEAILLPKYNFGAPRIAVDEIRVDGTLVLRHEHQVDGRGLDTERARKVLVYIHAVWHRPVLLYTVDGRGETQCLEYGHGQF